MTDDHVASARSQRSQVELNARDQVQTAPPGSSSAPGKDDRPTLRSAKNHEITWLLLVYKVPSNPTRLRAAVWRRVKSLGAVHLQNGLIALPASPVTERSFRLLQGEIRACNGMSYLMRCQTLAGQAQVIAAFNAARDEEYLEIVDLSTEFEAKIANQLNGRDFTYTHLAEIGSGLSRLKNLLAKVQSNDVLNAHQVDSATAAIARCEGALEVFASRVYETDRSR